MLYDKRDVSNHSVSAYGVHAFQEVRYYTRACFNYRYFVDRGKLLVTG